MVTRVRAASTAHPGVAAAYTGLAAKNHHTRMSVIAYTTPGIVEPDLRMSAFRGQGDDDLHGEMAMSQPVAILPGATMQEGKSGRCARYWGYRLAGRPQYHPTFSTPTGGVSLRAISLVTARRTAVLAAVPRLTRASPPASMCTDMSPMVRSIG